MTNRTLTLANLTQSTEQVDQELVNVYYRLDQNRKINILASVLIIATGIIGNSSIIGLFSKRKHSKNPSKVYLLYLAMIDACFLVVHLFEDTVRNYNDIYNTYIDHSPEYRNSSKTAIHSLITFINITDKYEIMCRLINYFRYVLRFASAYIIVAFTLHRLYMVYFPLSNNFKTRISAKMTVLMITFLSAFMNLWVLFLFEIQHDANKDTKQFCDIKPSWKQEYFQISSFFICLVILIPILMILASDSLLAFLLLKLNRTTRYGSLKLRRNSNMRTNERHLSVNNISLLRVPSSKMPIKLAYRRKHLDLLKHYDTNSSPRQVLKLIEKRSNVTTHTNTTINKFNRKRLSRKTKFSIKLNSKFFKHCPNMAQLLDKQVKRASLMTIIISLSFALLNLPYLVVWGFFYKELTFNEHLDMKTKYEFFSTVQIVEIFFLLYYSLNFYFYYIFNSICSN